MSENEQVKLKIDDAIAMLPDGEFVHTFRNPGGMLIGADCDREDVIDRIRKFGAELSGGMASAMNHKIVLKDEAGHLFIETRQGEEDEAR